MCSSPEEIPEWFIGAPYLATQESMQYGLDLSKPNNLSFWILGIMY